MGIESGLSLISDTERGSQNFRPHIKNRRGVHCGVCVFVGEQVCGKSECNYFLSLSFSIVLIVIVVLVN